MTRVAVKMKLFSGFENEYRRRHDEIWPELSSLLTESGISDYSIFLEKKSNELFAVFKIENPDMLNILSKQPVMQAWWNYMKDIMETGEDNSPVTVNLEELFHHS